MEPVQLLLGSDIGLWAVEAVEPRAVAHVVTSDREIARRAMGRGLDVSTELIPAWRSLSVHYPFILSTEELATQGPIYNLHPGYLPWGRGHFPLVWAIVGGEPAGATIHRMVSRVDAGPIVDQVQVRVRADDTGGSLHERIRQAERELFLRWWSRLTEPLAIPERSQPPGGSFHTRADFNLLLMTDPRSVNPADSDQLRRALTFPGKPGLGDTTDE